MPTIELFDGTRNPKFGKALIKSFSEIAKYQRIEVKPDPGSIDIGRFNILKRAEIDAYNPSRNQMQYTKLLDKILSHPYVNVTGGHAFVLIEQDIYADNLNWCFGGVSADFFGGKHLIISTYRLQNLEVLTHIATHELGHMFGAASPGRRNTEENLGSHCTNLCIMQQKLTVPDMIKHSRTLTGREDKFCYECGDELKMYNGP